MNRPRHVLRGAATAFPEQLLRLRSRAESVVMVSSVRRPAVAIEREQHGWGGEPIPPMTLSVVCEIGQIGTIYPGWAAGRAQEAWWRRRSGWYGRCNLP
jgi:hypothetical protein